MPSGRTASGFPAVRVTALIALLALPAAANHIRDFHAALDGLKAGNLAAVDRAFLKDASRDCANRLLALYELGAMHHLGGDPEKSIGFFNSADAVAHAYEGRAVLSAGATGRATGAVLVNDSVMRYEGFGYDKVMARTLNAINFLLLGDLEGARVEVRKAEEYQRIERERHEREARRAPAPGPGMNDPALRAAYGRMANHVKHVRHSFENAFTYYLSSQIYLVRGEAGLNDAMVEIRRACELAPQAPGVRSAYLDIARAHSPGAHDEARARLGVTDAEPAPAPADTGSVVVFYETGLVPQMDEVRINLVEGDQLFGLAFPIYNQFGPDPPPLRIKVRGLSFTTSTILDTGTLAVKALQERMPGILARGLLGAAAKGGMQARAERQYGFFGALVSKVASAMTTSADRRSWLSLPAQVQVARFQLGAGLQRLELRAPGLVETVAVEVAARGHTFLLVRAFPGFRRIDVRTFRGGDGGLAPPMPPPSAPGPEP